MAYQQLLNSANPATTLAASCLSGATTISVNSLANLSATPIYTIVVVTSSVPEFMLVTGVSGSGPYTLTVTRQSELASAYPAAAHSGGDSVYCILSAGALTQALLDTSNIGVYASAPTSATGARQGMRYKCSDSPHEYIFDGSAWVCFFEDFPVTPPLTTGWSWYNQGTATLITPTGRFKLAMPNATLNWRARTRALPGSTFTVTIRSYGWAPNANSSVPTGLYVTDGTKLTGIEVLFQSGVRTVRVERMTNATTDNSTVASTALASQIPYGSRVGFMFRIQKTATPNHVYSYSLDDGASWITLATESTTAFLTANAIGFGGVSVGGETCVHELVSWAETP